MVNKRYYKKKGPSFREKVRCPLCGKISQIGYFSQDHQFGVYRWRYAGKGDISVTLVQKSPNFMSFLYDSFKDRFLSLLEKFAGCKYYSQSQMNEVVEKYKRMLAEQTMRATPQIMPMIITQTIPNVVPNVQVNLEPNIIPAKVVIE